MAEEDDDTDEVIERFLELVLVTPPPMPSPGHQRAARVSQGPVSIERRAEDALRDLIDLGGSAEDLSALARGIRALALADALEVLAEGETGPSTEFLYAYRELMAP